MGNPVKHSNRSSCPCACVLDIIGDKWSVLIIRDMLLFGHHEFKEFVHMPEKISTNILTNRLKKLLDYEIISVIPHPTDKKRKLYYLTMSGKGFVGLMAEIISWADRYIKGIYIPEETKKEVISNPEDFKLKIFNALENWEKQNLKKAA